MNSALCVGWLSHRRLVPKVHAFTYRMGMFYLDLDEHAAWMSLSRGLRPWRLAPLSWRETDYLPALTGRGMPLAQAARSLVCQALGQTPEGPVHLLTQLRCWGLSFNPVSFYFCHDADQRLAAILLEVRNTPWRERFHYVLPVQGELSTSFTLAKAFHVSPFMPLDMEYRLTLRMDADQLRIHMQNWQDGQKVFDATLNLQRQPLTRQALRHYILTFPWMSLRTVSGIYWQALRLLLKRLPVHDHAERRGDLVVGQPCEDPDHAQHHPER